MAKKRTARVRSDGWDTSRARQGEDHRRPQPIYALRQECATPQRESTRTGTRTSGVGNGRAKLGEEERLELRKQLALALRLAGATFRQIGHELTDVDHPTGVTAMTARAYVNELMSRTDMLSQQSTEQLIETEFRRLEETHADLRRRVKGADDRMAVRLHGMIERVSRSRRQLFQLNTPDPVALTDLDEKSPADLITEREMKFRMRKVIEARLVQKKKR